MDPLSALQICSEEYQRALLFESHQDVRDHLEKLHITWGQVDRWGIGWCPYGWPLVFNSAFHPDDKMLEDIGVIEHDQTSTRDRMEGRIVFPQKLPTGEVVGFLGRTIPELEPSGFHGVKYLSTKTTPWYRRREILYGLEHLTRPMYRIVVVEGPMDVLALEAYRQGDPMLSSSVGVVALNTAEASEYQVQLLQRYTDRVMLMLDNDDAGRKATERFQKKYGDRFKDVSVIKYPIVFSDPADWVRWSLQ